MNVKILKDFVYSLDGIRPTSFKKGDVVSSFNAKEVQKLTKSGRVGPEKAGRSREKSEEDKLKEKAEEDKLKEKAEEDKLKEKEKAEEDKLKENSPHRPQANRGSENKTGK